MLNRRIARFSAILGVYLLYLLAVSGYWYNPGMFIQGILGVSIWDESEILLRDSSGQVIDSAARVDISSMPTLGFAVQAPLGEGSVKAGLEGGLLFAFQTDDIRVNAGGGTAYVNLENSFMLWDLFGGAFVETTLSDSLRLYLAGGPALLLGYLKTRPEGPGIWPAGWDDSDNDTAIGLYGRAGIDFSISDLWGLGIGVRGLASELSFNQVGEVDLVGIQPFVAFTGTW